MQYVVANKEGNNEFIIPVSWEVCDRLKVKANSLEEALQYCLDNVDYIPLGDEPEYIDASYRVEEDLEVVKAHNE